MNIQRNIDKDPFSQQILKTEPYPYLVKYSLDFLKKKVISFRYLIRNKK